VYLSYLQSIFSDLLKIYNFYSQQISAGVQQGANNALIKPMKAVRRDVLKLIQTYILKETDKKYSIFYIHFLPQLKLLVDDYQQG
jgi:hypothetical protein